MIEHLDTLVVLGAPTSDECQQRTNKMVELYEAGLAGHVITTGAPSAAQMGNSAVNQGVPRNAIAMADWSLDTIGDALAVKDILRRNAQRTLGLITTDSHLDRSSLIFDHVLGSEYKITPFSAGPFPERNYQGMYELVAKFLSWQVLSGTEVGDHQTIQERLFKLYPGYTDDSRLRITINHGLRLCRLPLTSVLQKDTA